MKTFTYDCCNKPFIYDQAATNECGECVERVAVEYIDGIIEYIKGFRSEQVDKYNDENFYGSNKASVGGQIEAADIILAEIVDRYQNINPIYGGV